MKLADMRIGIVLFLAFVLSVSFGPSFVATANAAEAWSLIVIPDTQNYTINDTRNAIFEQQMQWIVDNKEARNIQAMVHLGDIVDNNSHAQWTRAKRAISILDGKVPYALAPGNHDYGTGGTANVRETPFNNYFLASDNPLNDPAKGGILKGTYQPNRLENSYSTFRANNVDYMLLALEWGPRNGVVAWANQVVADHPNHRVILFTHAYMYSDSTRYDWATKGTDQTWNPHSYGTANDADGTNDGQELWDKLVNKHPNVIMTLNGHVLNGGLGFLTSENDFGHDVHQMLFNMQREPNGGDGWLRILEFDPDNETVRVTTYSPYLEAWRTDAANEFTMNVSFVPEPSTCGACCLAAPLLLRSRAMRPLAKLRPWRRR